MLKSCILYISCTPSQQYVFSDLLSNFVDLQNHYRNVASPSHELSSVSSELKPIKTFYPTDHMHAVSLQYELSCDTQDLFCM